MTLAQFWFILITVLWTGFFVLEGFDLGVGMLHGIVGRDEAGRRPVINTIGPLWDGNEVWLIVAGAAMFAAFPGWYATMFSALYLALVLLLISLIIRGVAFVLICLQHGATFLCLKTTDGMRERSWLAARRVAPFTAAAVTGFIIWTHVTASTAFFLNVIELLAVLAAIAAAWLVYEHREGFAFAASTVTIAACFVSIFVYLYP